MGRVEQAEEALNNLNNMNLFNFSFDGKMIIEFSNLIDLNLSLKTLDGKGFFFKKNA